MFSVIMPFYNASATLVRALESVRAQVMHPAEIIAVDDCSTDGGSDVVEKWAAEHPEIPLAVIKSRCNQGPAGARNMGIKKACGEWLAFIDADDEWVPDKLLVQKSLIEANPGARMLCGKTGQAGEDKSTGNTAVHELVPGDFALANPVATSTVVIKKDAVIGAGGFDERFRGPEDYDLWMRIAGGNKIIFIEKILAAYGEGRNRISFDERTFLPQVKAVIEKAYGPGGVLNFSGKIKNDGSKVTVFAKRKAMAWQYLSAAWAAAERGAPGRAWGLFLRSLCWWPFSFKPERSLPWGRFRIVVFILRRMV